MVKCNYCKENIEEDLDVCPLCGKEFNEEDKAAQEEEIEQRRSSTKKKDDLIREDFARRSKPINAVSVVLLGLLAADGVAAMVYPEKPILYIAAVLMVLVIITFIVGIVRKVFKCPFCGGILYRNNDDYCRNCGKKIR